MDILKKIFTIVLLLFPLGEIVRLDFGNGIVVKPLDIALSLLFGLSIIFKFRKKEEIKQKYIFTPVIIFAAIGGISLLLNSSNLSINQLLVSGMYLIRWVVYAGIFFSVSGFDRDFKKRNSNLLLVVGFTIVGLGYFQYIFYSNAKNLLNFGWDEHMYRMFSTFLDPNFVGIFFVLFFLFAVNLFLKKKNRVIGLIAIFTLGAVFLTFSRSALVMLIASSSLLFVFTNKKRFMFVLLLIIVLVLIVSSRFYNIENINLFRVVSTEARLETTANAIAIIKDNPILGVGFNAYRYTQLRYGFRNDKAEIASHADAGADNSFLFVLATTGIVGFFSYLFLWYRIIKRYWFSPLVVSSILGVFVSSFFINSL
ncbi:MAG: O-antigen ligase family protein, partial [Nanoarchaeota archaeon]